MNLKADHSPQKMLIQEGWDALCSGHPWVRLKHLKNPLPLANAGVLHWGEHWFFYSARSQIPLRRLGPSARNWLFEGAEKNTPPLFIDSPAEFHERFAPWLREHLRTRWDYKQSYFPGEGCFRWIFSESDLIPGLIVDRFDTLLVAQIQSAPVELFWPVIEEALKQAFREATQKTPTIVVKRNSAVRDKEGLAVEDKTANSAPRELYHWNGLKWWMQPGGAQKTGSYLDQRVNHLRAAEWAERLGRREAWDLCCFEGGFGLHLAQKGLQVQAVDQSASALEITQRNAAENGFADKIRTEEADIFEWIRAQTTGTDVIALDPPSFVKDAKSKSGAMKGFKELNLRAMKNLRPGGLLISCACSHHVSRLDYERMLRAAAHDVRREFNVLDVLGPSPDHAPLVNFPEGTYLQAWFLRLV